MYLPTFVKMVMPSYSVLDSLLGLVDIMMNAVFIRVFNKHHNFNLPQTYSKKNGSCKNTILFNP